MTTSMNIQVSVNYRQIRSYFYLLGLLLTLLVPATLQAGSVTISEGEDATSYTGSNMTIQENFLPEDDETQDVRGSTTYIRGESEDDRESGMRLDTNLELLTTISPMVRDFTQFPGESYWHDPA